jgi:hypothetical protein
VNVQLSVDTPAGNDVFILNLGGSIASARLAVTK